MRCRRSRRRRCGQPSRRARSRANIRSRQAPSTALRSSRDSTVGMCGRGAGLLRALLAIASIVDRHFDDTSAAGPPRVRGRGGMGRSPRRRHPESARSGWAASPPCHRRPSRRAAPPRAVQREAAPSPAPLPGARGRAFDSLPPATEGEERSARERRRGPRPDRLDPVSGAGFHFSTDERCRTRRTDTVLSSIARDEHSATAGEVARDGTRRHGREATC